MAIKFWEHLKLKNGDKVKFVPPAPDGERLGGVTETERGKINSALQEHQSLAAYRTAAEQDQIHDATKQDVIADLQTIRDGASAGSTALQSVPNTYRTASAQDALIDSNFKTAATSATAPAFTDDEKAAACSRIGAAYDGEDMVLVYEDDNYDGTQGYCNVFDAAYREIIIEIDTPNTSSSNLTISYRIGKDSHETALYSSIETWRSGAKKSVLIRGYFLRNGLYVQEYNAMREWQSGEFGRSFRTAGGLGRLALGYINYVLIQANANAPTSGNHLRIYAR